MNVKSRMIAWVTGVIVVVVVLMIAIVSMEPFMGEGMTRAEVCKALALAMTTRQECEERESERNTSYFSQKEKGNWFVKYMDYLYEEGILNEELTPPTLSSAQDAVTYEEISYAMGKIAPNLKRQVGMNRENRTKSYPKAEWQRLYPSILKKTDPEGQVQEIDAILYGTPSNLSNAESWTAYTTKGAYGFQGLALDAYIDCEIRFFARDGEMISFLEMVSEDVVYENVWLAQAEENSFTVYMGAVSREFPIKGTLKAEQDSTKNLAPNLADLTMEKGRLKKLTLKKDRIQAKVLSVTEDAIELEGYGRIPLSENFKVYKLYGDFKVLDAKDILVGYDLQEFAVADGKLCAALLEREFDAKTIRVLLMDNGFTSLFHPSAEIVLNCPAALSYEDSRGEKKKEHLEAGTVLSVTPEDERLVNGRMIITPEADEGITIRSLTRSQGNPVYSGSLEISAEENGLVLINDVYLEDYLIKVVPSEMPPSYEKEALKAQAVCARTYAYRQIQGNTYSQYGAHVDDSTNFQVYNNTKTDERTTQAVKETYGQMLFYEDNPAEIFYYSTSCGWGADASVWGSAGASLPYLRAMEIKDGGKELTREACDSFESYIKEKDKSAYDSSYPMFRWQADISAAILSSQVSGAGTVSDVEVVERGAGGIVTELKVTGDQGTVSIKGQNSIRAALGNENLTVKCQDSSEKKGNTLLPSAFFTVEKRTDKKGEITFHIYGGGFGHGVGMSQNAAQGMAKKGKTCKEILDFFYHGAVLREAGKN